MTDYPEHDEHLEVEDARDPRIAAAVARLDGLTDTPLVQHVEVYEDVHRVLQDALADAAVSSETGETGETGDTAEPGPGDARP
ncbi:MAG: hypothetical protein QOD68_1125 [Actinomycetota bacterium]|nr:hypothetical protein [Actinomycetota bacterium]